MALRLSLGGCPECGTGLECPYCRPAKTLTKVLDTGCSAKLPAERAIAQRISDRLAASLETRNEQEPDAILSVTFSTWHDVDLVARALRDWGEEE